MKKDQYYWQEEALESWKHKDCRGIVEAFTGTGKTYFALRAIRYLLALHPALVVMVVVPTKAIMNQWYSVLAKNLGHEKVCRFKGREDEQQKRSVVIYVINSARYNLARRILNVLKDGGTILLVADECHHYASRENSKIFEFHPYTQTLSGEFFSLGLSATLKAGDLKEVLAPNLGPVVYKYSIDRAKKDEVVSEFVIMQIAIRFSDDEWDEYVQLSDRLQTTYRKLMKAFPFLRHAGGDIFPILQEIAKHGGEKSALANQYLNIIYKRKRLVYSAENRNICANVLLKEIVDEKRCIIFSESIEQAESLYKMIAGEYPGAAGRFHSKMGEQANKNTLQSLRDGQIRILISCKALDEGLDVPEMDAAIIISGTSVRRQRIQRLGRIIRASSGKKQAVLYYLYIRESTEEKSYFPTGREKFVHAELEFKDETNEIVYPLYDKYAAAYLQELRDKNVECKALDEAFRCTMKGRYRGDWLLGSEECFLYAKEANDIKIHNYWFCMGKIARAHERTTGTSIK